MNPTLHPMIEDIQNTVTQDNLDKNTIVNTYVNLDQESKNNFNTCFICLDDFNDNNIIRKLKCVHLFHKECIDPWLLKENHTCPVCRETSV